MTLIKNTCYQLGSFRRSASNRDRCHVITGIRHRMTTRLDHRFHMMSFQKLLDLADEMTVSQVAYMEETCDGDSIGGRTSAIAVFVVSFIWIVHLHGRGNG